ncbi:7TM diverse intracellular signaling domain-containing protein [Lacinutrix salivirga]
MKQILLLTYLIGLSIYAQDQAYNPENSKGELYEYAEITDVNDSLYTISELISANVSYTALESDNQSLGFTSNQFWLRFKLENSSNKAKTYYLETARPVTDIVNLYQISKIDIQKFESGDQVAFNTRQVQHRSSIFKLEIAENTTQQVYLNLSSDGETINIPLKLYNESAFWMMNYKQQLFLGLFYGLLFLAALIYLFFYSSLKEKTFLYYSCYVFSIALMQAALDGLIFQYILPESGYLNSRAVLITALFSNFFLLKYCEYFLKVPIQLSSFKKAYNAIYIAIAVLFTMVFVSPQTMQYVYPISNLNGLLSLVLILVTVFTMRYKRISIDGYFSFGILFLVIGLAGFVMNNLSLLPNNFYTLNSAKFGIGFEVIFLSLSMTNLIRNLREEKETSQELALTRSQEISKLKTYFMSNMSHELRTPINAIMGIAETELSKQSTKEERQQYEIIKNASLSLLSNVNDILDFEQIEKNELKLQKEDFNPSIALNEISNNWKVEAHKKGLSYTFEMDYDIPVKLSGDNERFVQIINNVLSNAVKFTNEGAVHFKVKCLTQPNNISRFSFHISDTGIGMNEDIKKNVFDSFNQMQNNHKRKFGGIGLGLTIVKHLVALFEGSLTIESEENKGTDVFIDLPLKVVETSKIETYNTQSSKSKNEESHVLVVEDNMLNQMVMRKLLGSNNAISFSVVNNGKEAIDELKRNIYDIVLMDLQMPVMDGYEATRIIRSGKLGDALESIPIIAVTADAMQETKQKVLDLGMNDYMTKPIKKELLFKKINSCKLNSVLKIA